ncbi:MAG: hypothetical protein AAFR31_14410 [Cyanobacteria bacterium J06627_8]
MNSIPLVLRLWLFSPMTPESIFLPMPGVIWVNSFAALDPSSSTYAAYTEHLARIETYMEFVDDADESENVAAATLDIALQPKGDRPQRTRLGGQLPTRINEVAVSMQQQVIKNGPFSDWAKLSS